VALLVVIARNIESESRTNNYGAATYALSLSTLGYEMNYRGRLKDETLVTPGRGEGSKSPEKVNHPFHKQHVASAAECVG
jgi:hypothetical protein